MIEAFGPEHQLKHAGIFAGKFDIGIGPAFRLTVQRRSRCLRPRIHCLGETLETNRCQFAEQSGHVAEMMGRRGMGNTRLARDRTEGKTTDALALRNSFSCLEQRLMQIAVMIGLWAIQFLARICDRLRPFYVRQRTLRP